MAGNFQNDYACKFQMHAREVPIKIAQETFQDRAQKCNPCNQEDPSLCHFIYKARLPAGALLPPPAPANKQERKEKGGIGSNNIKAGSSSLQQA